MAYKVEVFMDCNNSRCNRKATHEVFNCHNASHGKFCLKDAKKLVEKLTEAELKSN